MNDYAQHNSQRVSVLLCQSSARLHCDAAAWYIDVCPPGRGGSGTYTQPVAETSRFPTASRFPRSQPTALATLCLPNAPIGDRWRKSMNSENRVMNVARFCHLAIVAALGWCVLCAAGRGTSHGSTRTNCCTAERLSSPWGRTPIDPGAPAPMPRFQEIDRSIGLSKCSENHKRGAS